MEGIAGVCDTGGATEADAACDGGAEAIEAGTEVSNPFRVVTTPLAKSDKKARQQLTTISSRRVHPRLPGD